MTGQCDCCQFDGVEVRAYKVDPPGRSLMDNVELETYHYCDLCADSYASVKQRYASPEGVVMACICHVGNAILKELRS